MWLAPGGRLVTLAADSEGTQDERTKKAFFIVEPNGAQLAEIAHLLAVGELHCFVGLEVPFADASAAYQNMLPKRDRPGKVVIFITSDGASQTTAAAGRRPSLR